MSIGENCVSCKLCGLHGVSCEVWWVGGQVQRVKTLSKGLQFVIVHLILLVGILVERSIWGKTSPK